MIQQGSSRSCFVCGLENPTGLHIHFYQPEPRKVQASVRIPVDYQGWNGVVHGGIIAAMLDEAAGRAFLNGAELDRFFFTAKLEIRYRRPVPVDTPLMLYGEAKEERGKVVIGSSRLVTEDGVLLAEAEAVMTTIPDEKISEMKDSGEYWIVDPEK